MAKLVIGTDKVVGTPAVVKLAGIIPTGTLNVTENGIYDVTEYASAEVNTPALPEYYQTFSRVSRQVETHEGWKTLYTLAVFSLPDFTNIDYIGDYFFAYRWYGDSGVIWPDNTLKFTGLKNIIGTSVFYRAFWGNTVIKKLDLSDLESTKGAVFEQMCINSSIEEVDLRKLKIASSLGSAFYSDSNIKSINLDSLETITDTNGLNGTFAGCGLLTTITLNKFNPSSNNLAQYTAVFDKCYNLENVYFGGLVSTAFASARNQFQKLCSTTTGSTAPEGCTIHFPSNFDPNNPNKTFDASTLTGYPTFGGSSSYIHVAFDLPATE